MEPLHAALSELLQTRKMTQTDLWSSAGVSSSVVSRYLKGERGCKMDYRTAETIAKLAEVLGVEPDYFLEYRAWRVSEIMKQRPALADKVYDLLIRLDRSAGGSSK